MPYKITDYTREQAKKYNVTIKPSENKNKKIDVYKDGKKISSVGAINYKDYPTYMKEEGKEKADERRKLYKLRHKKDLNSKNGKWANRLLW
jgi:hypothetical protein